MSNFVLEYKPYRFIVMDSIVCIKDFAENYNPFSDKKMYIRLSDGSEFVFHDKDIQNKIRAYFTTI